MADLALVAVGGDSAVPVVTVTGEVDLSNAAEVVEAAAAAVPNAATALVVDLSATTYLDSSGIHALFGLARRLSHRQQRLHLVVPAGSPLLRVLVLTDLPTVVPVHGGRETAVDAARAGSVSPSE